MDPLGELSLLLASSSRAELVTMLVVLILVPV